MKANPAITSFNAGVLSPLLAGRPDLEKFGAGLSRCDNMLPRVQGALMRSAGTIYVSEVKDSAERCWLMPFVFSQADAFILEFGPEYIRFYRDRGVLVDGPDPYEIATPYLAADLTRADGTFGLRFEQSGDIVYIACAGHQPRKLIRAGNTSWTLDLFEPDGGPFKDQNTDEEITVTVAGTYTVGGTVTVTASDPIFDEGHVGGLMEIDLEDGADVRAWQVRTTTDVGDIRRADFKHYICTQVGPLDTSDRPAVCGESVPVHTRGKVWDGTGEEQKGDGAIGSIGAEWEYLHAGYGWLRITAFTSATEVAGEVISRLPEELATDATHRWALPAWSDVEGWPDNVCFFRERLTFVRGQQVWHSTAGDFENFKARVHGEVLPDSAVSLSVQSGQGNPIEWVTPTRNVLFLGTNGGEHTLKQQTNQQPYGPGNTQQDPETEEGGKGLRPFKVGPGVLFAEAGGRRLRLMVPGQDGYEALDLNKYHGVLPSSVVDIAWQKTPNECAWVVLANGETRALTLQMEDKIVSWSRQLSGVESVAVIPSPDGTRDDVWMIVAREVDGETRRYVEYRAAEYDEAAGDDQALTVYTQSALTYEGASTATLTGLDHLEGLTVNVKADGAAHPQRVVTGGEITLQAACTKAVVGLPLAYAAKLMPLEAGGGAGTSQAKPKRVHKVNARLYASRGGRIGPDFGQTTAIEYANGPMGEAPPMFTGDRSVDFGGGYDGQATVAIEGDDDFPFCIVALFPELVTYD